jgi:molybdenum cofactor cytidylyltransferase
MRIAAVVVAAGKSERMGENKLLIEFCGKPLLGHVLDVLSASRIDEIVVVVGHKPWQLDSILKERQDRVRVVVNEKYEEGMASSFKKGLRTVMDADAVFLVLADQPLLDAEFLDKMIGRLEAGSGASIVSPTYKGKKGHPVLFSKGTYHSILDLSRNGTLREVLARYAGSLAFLKGDRWTITDIDTPDDVGRVRRLMRDKK